MTRPVRLLVPLLALAFVGGATAAVRAVAEGPPATADPAPAAPPKAKLTAWRAGAHPPAPVPPNAIVRAAKRDGEKGAGAPGKRRSSKAAAPVEIIWHAPGS